MRTIHVLAFLLTASLQFGGTLLCAEASSWVGNEKILKLRGKEYVIGVRAEAAKGMELIGERELEKAVYAENVFPMTIAAQSSYVIYNKTDKKFYVLNIALCFKGKDKDNSEKTDWAGEIRPSGDAYEGDIVEFRKYDKTGPGMRAPYYSMGRSFPTTLDKDGTCTVAYNYFGKLVLKLKQPEVSDDLAVRVIEAHDANYRPKDDDQP